MTNQDRIERVKENNKLLLKNVKEEMNNSSQNFLTSVAKLVDEIKENTTDEKKEKYFNKAKDKLEFLASEINNADSLEKVTDLRNKLNYYITKIRREMDKKEFISFEYFRFKDLTIKYRNSIAKDVRYLKRENNISKMEKLNSNYDNLSEEEKIEFKKLLRREQNYNSKNLVEYKKEEKRKEFFRISNLELNEKRAMEIISLDNQNELNEKLGEINRFYRLNTLPTYDSGVGTNVLKLVRNIPNYLKNKGILSSINKKNNYFDDKVLDAFIEYNKRRNSIRLSLKEILNPKYRDSMEALYLRKEEYCPYWIKKCYGMSKILKR